jgi:hypothetical protein
VRRTGGVAFLVALMAIDESVGILVGRVRDGLWDGVLWLFVLLGRWLVGDGGVDIELSLVLGVCGGRAGVHLRGRHRVFFVAR